MNKSIKGIIGLAIIASLCWYFFIKDYNYKVTFKIHQTPSVVYDHLIRWNDYKKPSDSVVKTLSTAPSKTIEQSYRLNDTTLAIYWTLKQLNDSTTKVTAKISDTKNPFIQNINVINPNSAFVKTSQSTVKRFANSLVENKTNYRIGPLEKSVIPSKYCAYLSLKSKSTEKAKTMLFNIPLIMNSIKDNKIELDGHPFLEVTNWNIETDSITFNFCFPIKKQDSFPAASAVKFKETKTRPALKTSFNGNYKISDRAWLTVKDYANFNAIEIENYPVEFFLNDPHTGTDALSWEAEIYLPLKKD